MKLLHKGSRNFRAVLCLFILLLSILTGVIVLMITSHRFSETIDNHNMDILNTYAQRIEEGMGEVIQLSYNLRTMPLLNELADAEGEVTPEQRQKISAFLERSTAEMAQYQLVSSFFVFFDKSEKVLTSTGYYDAYLFYLSMLRGTDVSYDAWRDALCQASEEGEYVSGSHILLSGMLSGKNILYMRRHRVEDGDWRCQVILISNEAINRHCIRPVVSAEGYVGIYGNDGETIIEAAPNAVRYNPANGYSAGEGIMVLTTRLMEQYRFNLVLAMPKMLFTSRLWESYRLLRTVILGMIALILLSGSLFVYWDLIVPRNRLRRWVQERSPGKDRASFEEMQSSINQLFTDKERELEDVRQAGKVIEGERYLIRLLVHKESVAEELPERLQEYGIELPYPLIVVMIVTGANTELLRQLDEEELVNNCIMEPHRVIMMNRHTDRHIVLINLAQEINTTELCMHLEEELSGRRLEKILISLGSQEKLASMPESYDNACETEDYHFMYPDRPVLEHETVQKHTGKCLYTSEMENALVKAVEAHNAALSQEVLCGIFRQNFEKQYLEISNAHVLLYSLLNTFNKINLSRRNRDGIPLSPEQMILSCRDYREAEEQMEYLFRTLCEEEEDEGERPWRIKRIERYMQDHYLENTLSLEQVADHFHITPQYLSGLFKKHFMQNFTTYLMLMRLDYTQKLMIQTKLTLQEIAARSGFTNYLALHRAFQRYENQTPGTWREEHLNNAPEQGEAEKD